MGDDNKSGKDFLTVGPDFGEGPVYLRHRADHTLETGVLRGIEEGKPINAPLVNLKGREGSNVFDVEEIGDFRSQGRPASGPAMVATDSFREGWDRIFGGRQSVGEA